MRTCRLSPRNTDRFIALGGNEHFFRINAMSGDHRSPLGPEQATANAHLRFLREIRALELSQALTYFPAASINGNRTTVLELGAGTGQQARELDALGYDVTAIDLPSSHYKDERIYSVIDYDGATIPVETASMDVVFSSNVLEHVIDIDALLNETARIMRDNAIAVHVLPSSGCRLWSIPAHYVWLIRRIFDRIAIAQSDSSTLRGDVPKTPVSFKQWLQTFFPARHGERGVTLTEPYYYSRWWWCRKFKQHGFKVIEIRPNHIFYTMANAMTTAIPVSTRVNMSKLLGSACLIYVLVRD